jgi:hypothetical protein
MAHEGRALRTMATLSDEHLRALRFLARHRGGCDEAMLRFLARHRGGCDEAMLLAQGFTTGQLGHLVHTGLAKLRAAAGRTKVFRVKITAAGRKAIAE